MNWNPSEYAPAAIWSMHVVAELVGVPEQMLKLLPTSDDVVSPALRPVVCASQDWSCMYCRVDLKPGAEIDHMRPKSRGGPSFRVNLQALCKPCNGRKAQKTDGEIRRIYANVLPNDQWWQRVRPPRCEIDHQAFKDALEAKDQVDWKFGPRHVLRDTGTLLALWFHSRAYGTRKDTFTKRDRDEARRGAVGKIDSIVDRIGWMLGRFSKLPLKPFSA